MPAKKNDGLPAGVYPHGKKYRCRFKERPDSSPRWSKPFTDPLRCYEFKVAAESAIAAGRIAPELYGETIVSSGMTAYEFVFGPWKADYERRGWLPNTHRQRYAFINRHLRPARWANNQAFCTVTATQLDRWFDAKVKGTADGEPATNYDRARTLLWLVKDMYRVAIREAALTGVKVNVADGVTLRKPSGIARRAELARKRATARMHAVGLDHLASIAGALHANDQLPMWLMFLCALRIGEAFGLRIQDWDSGTRTLRIRQQFGVWFDDDDVRRYVKPWTKTDAGRRHIYVGPSLAAAIDAYMERVHGPNPAPDTLICVGPTGSSRTRSPDAGSRVRLQRAATRLKLRVDFGGDSPGALLIAPHDFRRTIGGVLHQSRDIDDRARSAYLGHRLAGVWDAADVTMSKYTPLIDSSMRKIAEVVENYVIEHNLVLTPPVNDLMTTAQVAKEFGLTQPQIRDHVGNKTLASVRNNPYASAPFCRRIWISRREVTDLLASGLPTPEVAVTIPQAAQILGLCTETVRVWAARSDGGLRRHPVSAGLSQHAVWITTESVNEWKTQTDRIAAGELLRTHAAAASLGMTAGQFRPRATRLAEALDLPPIIIRNVMYWDARICAKLANPVDTTGYIDIGKAADQLATSIAALRRVLPRESKPTLLNGQEYITEQTYVQLRATLVGVRGARANFWREAKRRARAATTVVHDQPDHTQWISVAQAAAELHVTPRMAEHGLAARGYARHLYEGTIYVRRTDIDQLHVSRDMAGYVTTAQAAQTLGVTQTTIYRMIESGRLHATAFPDLRRNERWIPAVEVQALRVARIPDPDPVTITAAEAAEQLDVSLLVLRKLIIRGDLPAPRRPHLKNWTTAVRLNRADVDDLQARSTCPPGHISVDEFAALAGRSAFAIYVRIRKGQLSATRLPTTDQWVVPETEVAQLRNEGPPGFLTVEELMAAADVQITRPELTALARRGTFDGAMQTSRRSWRFPPNAVERLRVLRQHGNVGPAQG